MRALPLVLSLSLGLILFPPRARADDQKPKRKIAPKPSAASGIDLPKPSGEPEKQVTLYLKNGGSVSGELVSETKDEVVLRFDYGDIGFGRAEIRRISRGGQADGEQAMTMPWEGEHARRQWPYKHDIVVKLTKGTVVDGAITAVTPQQVVVTQALPGGGAVEHTVKRADIEQLLFRHLENERSAQIAATLKELFPAMQSYDEGMFTIVTDSIPPVAKDYRRTVRDLSTEWYLTFFPLVKDRRPSVQHHIVIFDDWVSYIEYAATDGVPGWLAVGYFHPEDEVLYCFNMVGDRFSELLYDAYLGQFREARNQVSAMIKGEREAIFIEGQMSEFLQTLERAHAIMRQVFHQMSVDVLRHELTHAMFSNWRLQGIILSQMSEEAKEETAKKREFLEATDMEAKRRLLDELLGQERSTPPPEMRAANSWVVEGLAGYMEPSPIGGINSERLAEMQEARRSRQVLPLEFLHTFRMGSFAGMANQSKLYAYAQSWALCHFLMARYPEGFLAYLDRLAKEQPGQDQDTLSWLLAALGKDEKVLHGEFLAYLEQFPAEDPAWLKQMQVFLDLRRELIALAARLWSR